MEMVQMIIASVFIVAGVVLEILSIFGVFKLDYVLSRMHAAAIGDTGALGCIIIGLIIASGPNLFSLKLFFVWVFFWIGSAVCSHMITKMVIFGDREEAIEHNEFESEKGSEDGKMAKEVE